MRLCNCCHYSTANKTMKPQNVLLRCPSAEEVLTPRPTIYYEVIRCMGRRIRNKNRYQEEADGSDAVGTVGTYVDF